MINQFILKFFIYINNKTEKKKYNIDWNRKITYRNSKFNILANWKHISPINPLRVKPPW